MIAGTQATARIGGGAGFAGDRIAPARDLVDDGELDFLVLECLAERTIALGQHRLLTGSGPGYEPSLDRWVTALAEPLWRASARVLTNFGAADPASAGARVAELTSDLQVPVSVVTVLGDDVLELIDPEASAWEDGLPLAAHGELVSANAYLGADALLPALDTAATFIVCGRVADPSLFVAPLVHSFGWELDAWDRLAAGTVVGHLLECGAQVTGGYFADPPIKEVPDLARVGAPLAIVDRDGDAIVTKLSCAGGRVDGLTVAEQLAYEAIDPAAYVTPDVIADLTTVQVTDMGDDQVQVAGTRGKPRPTELKVSVGYRAGFRCEAEISFAGRNAVLRARLAESLVRERLGAEVPDLRTDVIGVNALHGASRAEHADPYECRLRVAGRAASSQVADRVGEEVTALYTTGPAGGGGIRVRSEEVIGIISTSLPRDAVRTRVVQSPSATET